jgi:hypothetical protein
LSENNDGNCHAFISFRYTFAFITLAAGSRKIAGCRVPVEKRKTGCGFHQLQTPSDCFKQAAQTATVRFV